MAIGVLLDAPEGTQEQYDEVTPSLVGCEPTLVLAQQREVVAVVERQLGAGERSDAERLSGLSELHRAVEAVVVCERERHVTLLGGRACELDWVRSTVEK